MKLYGYEKNNDNILELSEITVVSSVTELRKLVNFLEDTITESEKFVVNSDMSHFHLSDWDKEWDRNNPEIIIVQDRG